MPLPTVPENAGTAELRTALLETADVVRGIRQVPEADRTDDHAAEFHAARQLITELNAELDARSAGQAPDARGGVATSTTPAEGPETRSAGHQFIAAQSYEDNRGGYNAGYAEYEVREQRTLLQAGALTITQGADGGAWRPLGTPIPPHPRQRRFFVRDGLNVIPTTLGAVPYVQELNALTNEAGATAIGEGVTKPEVTLQFTQVIAPVVKIAAWVPVTEEIIEDAPMLAAYIDTRLSYMVDVREEEQILNGSGLGPNMRGIRQTSGLQTQTVVASDYPATIGLAIGKIENVDGDASWVATNPLDYWVAVTTRHANHLDNGYGGNAPAELASLTWGLMSIRSRSMESGKALVGSTMGATIADRMSTVIRVGNQHSTYFTENKVAVLAERREALLVHRPDTFVEATVPTS